MITPTQSPLEARTASPIRPQHKVPACRLPEFPLDPPPTDSPYLPTTVLASLDLQVFGRRMPTKKIIRIVKGVLIECRNVIIRVLLQIECGLSFFISLIPKILLSAF